jgi:hypothetical protein
MLVRDLCVAQNIRHACLQQGRDPTAAVVAVLVRALPVT